MGAYYTKEDITEYISKNTVIPFLFDAAKAKCKVAFENPGGPTVWDHLRDDPDRYIYPAIKHGISWDIHEGKSLEPARELPLEIAAGIEREEVDHVIEMRGQRFLAAPTLDHQVCRARQCKSMQALRAGYGRYLGK